MIRPLSTEEYHQLIQVSLRRAPASVWFKDAAYLNIYTGQVHKAHIYLSGKRIAYVGELQPMVSAETEIVELEEGQILVPGYIEPHGHPYQWYNPLEWGRFLTSQGTTVSINDNIFRFDPYTIEKATQFINRLDQDGFHIWLWWSQFDALARMLGQSTQQLDEILREWLAHPLVVQGGEYTSWPWLLKGDPDQARWMQIHLQEYGKRIEGHLPGASVETLNAVTAGGVSADHEALTGEDVLKRLRLGLYATLRYSSIRPDLPHILAQIKESPELNVHRLMLTNDGSMPFFVAQSGQDSMIKLVMEAGFKEIDAYRMATLNPASYYGLDQELGGIAPGRLAHMNLLSSLQEPTPLAVMVDGKWAVREKIIQHKPQLSSTAWLADYFPPLSGLKEKIDISSMIEIREAVNVGIQLMNEVITKPYYYDQEAKLEEDECYLFLIHHQGKYVLPTRIKGFATDLLGLASTYTVTKDFVVIGKDKEQMVQAFNHILAAGGGVYAQFADGERVEVLLPLAGGMSLLPMNQLIDLSNHFVKTMQKHGHPFQDPIYTLLFLTATHLPFIRVTEKGLYLIKEHQIISGIHPLK